MSYEEPTEIRAERVRVLIAAMGEEPTMFAGEGRNYGFAPGGWDYYIDPDEWRAGDYEPEKDLAWECAQVAQDLRDRQWDALTRLGALLAAGAGADLFERWLSLPDSELREAARHMSTLGWFHPEERIDAPEDEEG